ncbi:MAG: DUF1622 domain-containing protein [Gordonia sp. (in: high G+C Gram-positive bacteria)]|uniref:DUF1622 domain-containing protein n=1 Tax=Gordonia sp. (in: high G+C Gram-positive bacteria) TaxID=84139 RepID=UPI003BB70E92
MMEDVFTTIAVVFEALGAIAMVLGLILAFTLGMRALLRRQRGADVFGIVRSTLGGAIMLGLEILVAADLVRTITSKPSIEDALILGLIVLIRTVLSLSIAIEIDGVLPWRRAALTSGASVMAEQVRQDRAAQRDSS